MLMKPALALSIFFLAVNAYAVDLNETCKPDPKSGADKALVAVSWTMKTGQPRGADGSLNMEGTITIQEPGQSPQTFSANGVYWEITKSYGIFINGSEKWDDVAVDPSQNQVWVNFATGRAAYGLICSP